jgi:phosphoribosylaminoimidazole-succinocarboxamide synthase
MLQDDATEVAMIEGKTKRLTPGPQPGTIIMETKDELTGGDAAKRAHIAGIAIPALQVSLWSSVVI